jgi:hypothetical protein
MFLTIRAAFWIMSTYPSLWLIVGPLLVCCAGLVLSSWWGMVARPTRLYAKAYSAKYPYRAADWDRR